MAFADMAAELVGRLPGLSPFLADTFINRAWAQIRDKREWSFLIADSVVNCPAQIATGTMNITQFGLTAVANAAARTALLAVYDIPPATAKVLQITAVQIRFMGSGTTSQIYNIVSVTDVAGVLTLTLDRRIQEATSAASPYLVYRAYVTPPVADFKSWVSLLDMANGIRIVGPQLTYTSWYFDARDPQRQALGQSYLLGLYQTSTVVSANKQPVYELWPGCTSGQTFYCRYRQRGSDFTAPTDVQPAVVSDALIVEFALLQHGYPWAQSNIGHFPAMKNANWPTLILHSRETIYGSKERGITGLLRDALLEDDNMAMQSIISRGHGLKPDRPAGFWGPIDSNYIQRHPISW